MCTGGEATVTWNRILRRRPRPERSQSPRALTEGHRIAPMAAEQTPEQQLSDALAALSNPVRIALSRRLHTAHALQRTGQTVHRPAPAASFKIEGPCLVLVKGLDEGRTFALPPPKAGPKSWNIGRRRGAPVSLDFDPFVSTENAAIIWEEGTYF